MKTPKKPDSTKPPLHPPDRQPEPTPLVKSTGYGPLLALVIVIGLFLFSQIVVLFGIGVYAFVNGGGIDLIESVLESNRNLFLVALAISLVQLGGLFLLLRLRRKKLADIGLVRPVVADIARAALSWLVYIVIFVVAATILQGLESGVDFEQEQQLEFTEAASTAELFLIFSALVILPAFIEELLMRGFLFRSLRSKLRFWHSALVVSLLFGFAHFQFASGEPLLWVAFIDTFVLSMVLCYTVERYQTIWPAIFAHALKNGMAFTFLFLV